LICWTGLPFASPGNTHGHSFGTRAGIGGLSSPGFDLLRIAMSLAISIAAIVLALMMGLAVVPIRDRKLGDTSAYPQKRRKIAGFLR